MKKIFRYRNIASGDSILYYSDNNLPRFSINMIKGLINNTILRPHFRINILNSDETVNQIIPFESIISGGTYNENYQNGQRRSLSLKLFNNLGEFNPSINKIWIDKKFGFDIGFETTNAEEIIWFPKGIYCLNKATPSHEPTSRNIDLELGDKFSLLEGKTGVLPNAYTIPAGELIEEVIQDILSWDLGNGQILDPKPFIYHESFKGKTVQATISKEAGDTFGSIIIDLATQLSAEVFYDQEGHLNFVPIIEVTNDINKPIIYDFFAEEGNIFNLNLDFDFSEIINRVYVIGDNINGGYCQAMAMNSDPASPTCVQRVGYRTASPIKDSNITSESLAQERADYELRQKLILKTSGSMNTKLNPLLMVNNLINITDEYFQFKQERFIIQSLSFSLDYSGTMSVTLSNIKNLPFLL